MPFSNWAARNDVPEYTDASPTGRTRQEAPGPRATQVPPPPYPAPMKHQTAGVGGGSCKAKCQAKQGTCAGETGPHATPVYAE